MSHLGIFSQWKKFCYTITILVLCLGFSGANEVAKGVSFFPDRGLNPIPWSPSAPKMLADGFTPGSSVFNGTTVINDAPGHRLTIASKVNNGTVNSRLNAYAACNNYSISNSQITNGNKLYRVGYSAPSGTSGYPVQTYTLLMYPQVRDIIPPFATINSAKLIFGKQDTGGIPIDVEAYEITSTWDPRTFNASTLPTFSSSPIATGTWNSSSAQELTYRSLDITTTFNNWFSGANTQWGVMMTAATLEIGASYLQLTYPPRLYIDYEMPPGSYFGKSSGGTFYNDSITPPIWIPRRATYINRKGILSNNVATNVFVASHALPNHGLETQTYNWIVGGKPHNTNIDCVPMNFNTQTVSSYDMNYLIPTMPSIQTSEFSQISLMQQAPSTTQISIQNPSCDDIMINPPGPGCFGDCECPGVPTNDKCPSSGCNENSQPPISDPCHGWIVENCQIPPPTTPVLPDQPGSKTVDESTGEILYPMFQIGRYVFMCQPKWVYPDPIIDPPDQPGQECPMSVKPIVTYPPGWTISQHSYQNMTRQWVQITQEDWGNYYTNDKIDVSQSGWVSKWNAPSRTIRSTINGNMKYTGFTAPFTTTDSWFADCTRSNNSQSLLSRKTTLSPTEDPPPPEDEHKGMVKTNQWVMIDITTQPAVPPELQPAECEGGTWGVSDT